MRALDVAVRTLLGLAAGVGLISIFNLPGVPSTAAILLAIATAVAPVSGLLVFAALAPLGAPLGALFHTPASMTEALTVAFLSGAAARAVVRRRPAAADLPLPAVLLAVTILASYATGLAVHRAVIGPEPFRAEIVRLAFGAYFTTPLDLGAVGAAALFLEGLALFVAVRAVVGGDRTRLLALVRMMVAGGAGAAAMSLVRVAAIAFASGSFWDTLPAVTHQVRISALIPDVNAAGSYFALVLCLAVGLLTTSRGAARAGWTAAALIVASALWLTSSRAAILAVLALAALLAALSAWSAGRMRVSGRTMGAAAAVALAAILVVAFLPNRVTNVGPATEIRRDLALVALRLTAAHPAFGVGIGQFYHESAGEIQKLPVRRFYTRENAHNMFLQILAELGVVGFGCFVLVLVWIGRSLWTVPQWTGIEERRIGIAAGAGVAVFLGSALLGHPLLTSEPAIAFWTLSGGASAFAAARPMAMPWRLAPAALLVLVLASIPMRAAQAVADADLEHLGYGLSLWKTAEDGQRYRLATGEATVFAPGAASVVELPLQLDRDPGRPLDVNVKIRGRLVARLPITRTDWMRYRLQIPERDHARFIPVELELDRHEDVGLRVGKVTVVSARKR